MTRTWRQDITEALTRAGESWADIEICTWDGKELGAPISAPPATPFGLFTAKRMYYLTEGAADVLIDSVPREPDGTATAPPQGELRVPEQQASQKTGHPMYGPRAKLLRAREQIERLGEEIEAQAPRRMVSVRPRFDAKSREIVFYAEHVWRPPVRWSVMIGEIVHNLRSALDLLAWQLVENDGGTPGRHTGYPIAKDLESLDGLVHRRLPDSGASTIQLIRQTSPYAEGNPQLWTIHDLNIIDKHRLLVVVGIATDGIVQSKDGITFAKRVEFSLPRLLTEEGTELYRLRRSGLDESVDSGTEMAFGLKVALGDGGAVKGKPVIPVLMEFAREVEGVLDLFAPLFE